MLMEVRFHGIFDSAGFWYSGWATRQTYLSIFGISVI
jgi:allantoicase